MRILLRTVPALDKHHLKGDHPPSRKTKLAQLQQAEKQWTSDKGAWTCTSGEIVVNYVRFLGGMYKWQ